MRERGPSGPDPCPDLSRCCVCAVCVCGGGSEGQGGLSREREREREGGGRERRVFLCFSLFPSPLFPLLFSNGHNTHTNTQHTTPNAPLSAQTTHGPIPPSHTHLPPKHNPPERAPPFSPPPPAQRQTETETESVCGEGGMVWSHPPPFIPLSWRSKERAPTHPQGATRQRR